MSYKTNEKTINLTKVIGSHTYKFYASTIFIFIIKIHYLWENTIEVNFMFD